MPSFFFFIFSDCFYRLGNLQFALSDYQQALELEPTDWQVYCRVAVVYCEIGVELFSRGQHLRAEELFSAAIQHNPKVSRFYICRARTRYELKVSDRVFSSMKISFYHQHSFCRISLGQRKIFCSPFFWIPIRMHVCLCWPESSLGSPRKRC